MLDIGLAFGDVSAEKVPCRYGDEKIGRMIIVVKNCYSGRPLPLDVPPGYSGDRSFCVVINRTDPKSDFGFCSK